MMTDTIDTNAAREWWASLTQDQRDLHMIKQNYREMVAERDLWRGRSEKLITALEDEQDVIRKLLCAVEELRYEAIGAGLAYTASGIDEAVSDVERLIEPSETDFPQSTYTKHQTDR